MDLVHIWNNDRYGSKVHISNILSWPIGHKGKKIKSQGQILEKPCVHFGGHSFNAIVMKLCQNVYLNYI